LTWIDLRIIPAKDLPKTDQWHTDIRSFVPVDISQIHPMIVPAIFPKFKNTCHGYRDRCSTELTFMWKYPECYRELASELGGQLSNVIRKRVQAARQIQIKCFQNEKHIFCNADILPGYVSEAIQYRTLDRQLWLY
jgi:hypothetical protein